MLRLYTGFVHVLHRLRGDRPSPLHRMRKALGTAAGTVGASQRVGDALASPGSYVLEPDPVVVNCR